MLIKEIMNTDVQKIDPKATVRDAAQKMKEKRVGCLLVVDGPRLAGIVTEDDIITKVVVDGRPPQSTTVEEIMVKEVVYIGSGCTIEEAAELMTEKKIKKLPVVDNKRLSGIVTATDIVAAEPKMIEHLGELLLFAKRPQRIAG